MRKRLKHGRAHVKLRVMTARDYAEKYDWPDPGMVPTVALRQVEQADTIKEVRAIVHRYLRPRVS